jgi:hypothetical protein
MAVRDGVLWRGQQTPLGPATVALESRPAAGEVHARAWGPGAEWALTWLPASMGGLDDPDGFEVPPSLAHVQRLHPHWRVPRTGLVFEALVAAALEQKVTGKEAWLGWRLLVRRYGQAAPGPAATGDCVCCRHRPSCGPSRRGSGCACTWTALGRGWSCGPRCGTTPCSAR